MENKPVFCSECGARLTGSAAFCPACGAKQVSVAATPTVDVKPATVSPAPVAAPVAAPETSLATAKPQLSKFGLVMTLLALGATLLAVVLNILYYVVLYSRDFSNIGMSVLQSNSTAMLVAWIAPLLAMVMVLTKNKKLAAVGIIFAGASLVMQFLFGIIYTILMLKGHDMASLAFIWRHLNGETLFLDFWRLFRFGANSGRQTLQILLSLFVSLIYWLKNILAAIGCLVAAVKKQK